VKTALAPAVLKKKPPCARNGGMFLADFHIHSKHSRATARNLDLEHLYVAAQIKGVTVLGTGDFTHPGWFAEIEEKLIPAEDGLFRLHPDIAGACDQKVPGSCRRPVRFLLTAEISNIYKKNEKTRKNHNLIFADTLETVGRLNRRLERIGNIRSDGRPILGLDARDLLELVLSVSRAAFLVPAHIWTPWFSLLGSKSGFDSVAECFQDLADHIFAVETGLSSDPPMNWRVSDLDGRVLISNSDAHSPAKIGREANLFDCELSYSAIYHALASGDPERFLGTVEFYPEEGKYHFDGHRKCGVCLSPADTRKLGGKCPVCGRSLTLGVLHRVQELADRPAGERPEKSADFISLVPLADLLSELLQVGPQSKKVCTAAAQMIERFGSEFDVLYRIDPECLHAFPVPLLTEAVRRMRSRNIVVEPGFDGEFGKVRIFSAQERQHLLGQKNLFPCRHPKEAERTVLASEGSPKPDFPVPASDDRKKQGSPRREPGRVDIKDLNPDQQAVVEGAAPVILVAAGPGTGKTRALTCRIVHMIIHHNLPAERILAVTFTNQAAEEMRRRLALMSPEASSVTVCTFHRLCLTLLQERAPSPLSLIDEDAGRYLVGQAIQMARGAGVRVEFGKTRAAHRISAAKQRLARAGAGSDPQIEEPSLSAVFYHYQRLLHIQRLVDYDDLIVETCRAMENDPAWRDELRRRFCHILIDEYQDLNLGQYLLVRRLVPETGSGQTLFAIGDPDQSIYGFRGSDHRFFLRFTKDYPQARVIELARNYRSTETILAASGQVIQSSANPEARVYSGIEGWPTVGVLACRSERSEAVAVGRLIEEQVGGTGFHAIDFGKVDPGSETERGFGDFAVLVRTVRQLDIIEEVLSAGGIPVQTVRKDRRSAGICAPLFSLLRLAEGRPTYQDLEVLLERAAGGVGAKTLGAFKRWAYQNRLSGKEAMKNAWRIPIPEMSRSAQTRLCQGFRQLSALTETLADRVPAAALRRAAAALKLDETIRQDADVLSDFDGLLQEAEQSGPLLGDLLSRIALKTDADMIRPRSETVSLMTLHGAKGLEFPVVVIAGCEDGFIPLLTSSDKSDSRLLEERRLFYVGMTRAKERLYFTWAEQRRVFGKIASRKMSPFVLDIERRLIDERRAQESPKKANRQQQLELFE
jgi:uncharacterized protein (TIGR00375 family)